jgi:hypothetical protein
MKPGEDPTEYVIAHLDRKKGVYWPEAHSYLLQGSLQPGTTWESELVISRIA